ncbi:MAG: glycosyltransferase family 39 protein [Solirubrobacteraceae bacterium]
MLSPAPTEAAAEARPTRPSGPLGIDAGIWALAAITGLAAVLRFATLSSQSYWLDESQAVHELHLSFGAMLSAWSSYEWNPPLYLLVAWPWAKLFGTGEVALRSLSALLGIGLIPLIYLCGRELVSRPAGLAAAAFAAVNPFMIWYSQEAREYMLLVVLCAASLLFFARAWRTGGRRDLVWWTVLSILALLTQYYAGFLVAPEGLVLVYRYRSRITVAALVALGVVELALIPHVVPRLDRPVQFIVSLPLSLRLQQVPVTFGMNTLYRSSLVSYGLIGAAVVAAVVIGLLIAGAGRRELRGAGLAAALAGAVILVPLALALAGHDAYLARGLMPGWVPLAIVVAAACTARGARAAGSVLAVVLLAMFVYAGVRIDGDAAFQKPNWRGVAAALGARPAARRAIVAYDGILASAPLSVYLAGVPWSGPGLKPPPASVTVSELDVVGSVAQRLSALPSGIRVISSRSVDGYRVVRFGLARPWTISPEAIGTRATNLLGPSPGGAVVMVQPPAA